MKGVKVFEALSEEFGLHIFTNASTQIPTQPTIKTQLNLPSKSLIEFLRELHRKYLPLRDGKIYVSKPGLKEINPDWFGICIATIDGQVYPVGNWEESFLIQSIS